MMCAHFPAVVMWSFERMNRGMQTSMKTGHMQESGDTVKKKQSEKTAAETNRTDVSDGMTKQFGGLAGVVFGNASVHFNSGKPAKLSARAYARGNKVHIGPKQEEPLKLESRHMVQQKQGLVEPTVEIDGQPTNEEERLGKIANMIPNVATIPHKDQIINNEIIQRQIAIGRWILSDVDAFCNKLPLEKAIELGERRYGFQALTPKLTEMNYRNYIEQMMKEETLYRSQSYRDMQDVVCRYISDSVKWPLPPPSVSSFQSFTQESFRASSSYGFDDTKPLFAPSSPLRKASDAPYYDWKRADDSFSFQIGQIDSIFSFGGSGKFMHQAGTYENHITGLPEEKLATEISRLFQSGGNPPSTLPDANILYALIVGIEGCARSMHNIATSAIFFQNYETLKATNPDKGLLELMQMFLTFVQKDGAMKSKNYIPNPYELQMITAHLQSNGISITAPDAIGEHLKGIVQGVLMNSKIRKPQTTD